MPKSARPLTALAGVRVLLVDDVDDQREMYALAFEIFGAIVRPTSTATEALAALLCERFDVLVSDVAIPEKNGYEFIREVRALRPEYGGRIPAIAVTGLSADREQINALDAGFDRFCQKPCTPGTLAENILALLSGSAAGIGAEE